MLEIYKDIQRINELDPASEQKRMCKLFEEAGELAQAVNKKLGRKVFTETEEQVINLIMEEAADTIQCALSYVDEFGISAKAMHFDSLIGNCKDDEVYGSCEDPAEEMIELYGSIGSLCKARKSGSMTAQFTQDIIMSALRIAGYYGIHLGSLKQEIKLKNLKWKKVIYNRNESRASS